MAKTLLKGMEGVFIPVKDPEQSAQWYKDVLGFSLIYQEEEAAVMKIAEGAHTVICLVRTENHAPMSFPENRFGVGKYYNFIPEDIEETHLILQQKEIRTTPIEGDGNAKFFTFYDPDGNPLGVCQ